LLLAAVGIDTLHHELRHSKKWGFIVGTIGVLLLYGGVGYLLNQRLDQSRKACFTYSADIRNPYVYAHTGMDAMKLVESIEHAAMMKKGQGMYEVSIAIASPASDYWPLPWYLRKYANVGYWPKVTDIPDAFKPDILIVSADQGDQTEPCIGKNAQSNFFGIRPGTLLILFVRE
jgi:predicted membrane-bound mannosyltransferase